MTNYFGQRLKASDAEKCPGEEACKLLGLPLSRANTTPETECPKCERRWTKEGFFDDSVLEGTELDKFSLLRAAQKASELDAVQRSGWAAAYPVQITPNEWTAIIALTDARSDYEREMMKDKKKEKPKNAYGKKEWEAESLALVREANRKKQNG